ncbi:MAG TPA: hypothetical protein VF816_08900 [Rhodocyclaceae bacterium]
MKTTAKILRRLMDALAFANAGNFREFEELLEESDRRRVAAMRCTARHYGSGARRVRRPVAALPLPQL